MRQFYFILFLVVSMTTFGQQRARVWYFGQNGAGLDFKCNPPTAITGGMYYTQEGCASISDTSGNILFYTKGDTVYDKSHHVMSNGFGIGIPPSCWGSSTQGALIVPQPGSDSLYYIFTVDCADDNQPNAFRYSIVDMSANGGYGNVISKNQHIKTPVTEKLAAIHHANGQDIWIVVHEHGTDAFYSYLVTSAGFNPVPVVSQAGQVQWLNTFPESMTRGYMKFSPNGKSIIVLSVSDQHTYGLYPELFHFNDATGQIALNYTIADADSVRYYGATFSPDNNLVYLSGGWKGQYVHQFKANSGSSSSFLSSKQVIFTTTSHHPSALQIGPDGKVYIATHKNWIDVIGNPNVYGAGCNYKSQAIWLDDCPKKTYSLYGLPNYPESYFRSTIIGNHCVDTLSAKFSYTGTCLGSATYFKDISLVVPDTINYWKWNFGDPASGVNNITTQHNPSHTFTSPGTYSVTLIVSTDLKGLCKTDTITTIVNVDVCTRVDEMINAEQLIKIYPNPFQETTVIELTNLNNSNIDIYTLEGRRVKHICSGARNNLQIELGYDLQNGVYLLTVQTNNTVMTKKLIKIE